jgi:uncharacterized protein YkwD
VPHGLVPLKENTALDASAAQHSTEMAAKAISSTNPRTTAFWKRIQHWYGSMASASGGREPVLVVARRRLVGARWMWMNSPEHKANILNPRWR